MSCNSTNNDSSASVVGDTSWINWFVGLRGKEFLCRVPNDYIRDKFNLTGLETSVVNFSRTFNLITEPEFNTDIWNHLCEPVAEDAAKLYGLIHARYIVTTKGINDMCLKYHRGDFGVCPRIFCNRNGKGQHVLPIGRFDYYSQSHVKVYCPCCNDIYHPRSRCGMLDGAMFGTSFPHMFFMQFPELRPEEPKESYTPRLYGFKLHMSAINSLNTTPEASEKSTTKNSTPKSSVRRSTGRRLTYE
ncbi:uncharacterized protein Dwil_GK19682 [Drosophila willistoni]|uniref:Casein kinase II subunit beta n=1 Tax=Drosophila willistoni TaxID=7260 RepID=B4MP20_DROWI|nr:suppressor-of-stellate-like protein isoform X1 [Drosophila willistoni]EDW73859.1 uncharacterized protein Dwil_GK19682 [Drosophila willistoni]